MVCGVFMGMLGGNWSGGECKWYVCVYSTNVKGLAESVRHVTGMVMTRNTLADRNVGCTDLGLCVCCTGRFI